MSPGAQPESRLQGLPCAGGLTSQSHCGDRVLASVSVLFFVPEVPAVGQAL